MTFHNYNEQLPGGFYYSINLLSRCPGISIIVSNLVTLATDYTILVHHALYGGYMRGSFGVLAWVYMAVVMDPVLKPLLARDLLT